MPTNSKCVYWSSCNNLYGKLILLTINRYDDKIIEVIVNYASKSSIYKKGLLLFLIIVINLLSLIFEVLSTKYNIAIFVVVIFCIYNIIFTIKLEKVLIVQSLGYQTEVHYTLGRTVKFIAWKNIESCFINEVISRQKVLFVLSLLTKETAKETIIPLFTDTMPRLDELQVIYQHIHDCHNS